MRTTHNPLAPGKTGAETTGRRLRFRREWLQIILVALVMRLLITFMGAFALWHGEPQPPVWIDPEFSQVERFTSDPASRTWGERVLLDGWFRWDTAYFVKIGIAGYANNDGSMSFMPLYPLLIQLTHRLTGLDGLAGALFASTLLCVLGLILFYEVALLELGTSDQAWQAFIYLITFPAAFFFYAGYSESLFLTLSLAMWLSIRRGNWPMAALASSLAVLTRLQGLALVVPMGWQALVSIQAAQTRPAGPLTPLQEMRSVLRFYTTGGGWRRLFSSKTAAIWVAVLFPVLTLLLYNLGAGAVGLNSVTGAYSARGSPTAFPWQGLVEFLGRVFTIQYLPSDYVDLFLLVLFLLVLVSSLNKITPALWLYSLAVLVLIFSRSYNANLLSGFMRFLLITFPFFISLAKLEFRRWARVSLQVIFLFAQLFLAWLFFLWIWVA